jgi:hypothetical protein
MPVEILPIGSFQYPDAEGFIPNIGIFPIQQDFYREVLAEALEAIRVDLPGVFHSIYVRGSVAKGSAILEISDIDTVLIVHSSLTSQSSQKLDKIRADLVQKYSPRLPKIEFWVQSKAKFADTPRLQFVLKTQCVCIFGENLLPTFPAFKIGKEAFGHVASFEQEILDIRAEILAETDPQELQDICVWLMKRILRTGFELVMLRSQKFTRDLYPCMSTFCEFYPNHTESMRAVLHLALNPSEDKTEILTIIDGLAAFICTEIKQGNHHKLS